MCYLFKDTLMALTKHIVHNSTGTWGNYDQVYTYVGNDSNIPSDSDCKMLSCERGIPDSGMLKSKSICILELMKHNVSIHLMFYLHSTPFHSLHRTQYSSPIKPLTAFCKYKQFYPLYLSTYSTHFLEVPHSSSPCL